MSDDTGERQAAMSYATETIRFASSLGVKNVVFHLGSAQLRAKAEALGHRLRIHGLRATRDLRSDLIDARKLSKRAYSQLIHTVDHLLNVSDDVTICLENRYSYYQYPTVSEIRVLINEFDSPRLKYWHDVGHMGAVKSQGLWDDESHAALVPSLAGVHVHDFNGVADHLPIGHGGIEFSQLCGDWMAADAWILELDSQASSHDLLGSLRALKDLRDSQVE